MRSAPILFVAALLALAAACSDQSDILNPRGEQPELRQTEQFRAIRRAASELRASREYKQALVEEEGFRDRVYRDIAGYATVGVGHLVREEDGLRVGDRVSRRRIERMLAEDIAQAEAVVAQLTGDLPLYQHEFDALIDLVYNIGEGNVSAARSPRLNDAIAKRDYAAMARELRYTTAKGAQAAGLIFRSQRRQRMFQEGRYDDPRRFR